MLIKFRNTPYERTNVKVLQDKLNRVFVPANKDHQKTKDQQPTSKLHPRLITVGSELFSDEVVLFGDMKKSHVQKTVKGCCTFKECVLNLSLMISTLDVFIHYTGRGKCVGGLTVVYDAFALMPRDSRYSTVIGGHEKNVKNVSLQKNDPDTVTGRLMILSVIYAIMFLLSSCKKRKSEISRIDEFILPIKSGKLSVKISFRNQRSQPKNCQRKVSSFAHKVRNPSNRRLPDVKPGVKQRVSVKRRRTYKAVLMRISREMWYILGKNRNQEAHGGISSWPHYDILISSRRQRKATISSK
ncbi:hypothetical protein WN51_01463 [Melipona quadrifasciata]|uniref:Uncharacterized protein n=1 Tax=Melipona quadrifasciata TaxID=166423 RepID=A0A0N0BF03_9HYME|nr:hypothetical protein WN51_01463 [Melipona quadrifasciata]